MLRSQAQQEPKEESSLLCFIVAPPAGIQTEKHLHLHRGSWTGNSHLKNIKSSISVHFMLIPNDGKKFTPLLNLVILSKKKTTKAEDL